MKAKQILFSFFVLGIFWWMATATSESSSMNEIYIINKTGHPVRLIQTCGPKQEILNVQQDQIILFDHGDTCSGDSATRYNFFSENLFSRCVAYPGSYATERVKINCDSLKARYYDYEPLMNYRAMISDSFYLLHPQYHPDILSMNSLGITGFECWLPADSTWHVATEIPFNKKYRGPDDYEQYRSTVFTIFYINRYGHRCMRKVGGKRFYKNLRRDNIYVIE